MFPAPVYGKPRAGRTPVAAPKTRRNSCLRFRRFPHRSHGEAARPEAAPRFRPGPAGAPPPGPPVSYGLRPFFARANLNQVEDVGPGGGLSPLRGLSGAELCPSGHIPLRGIQMTGQRGERRTSQFTAGSGHVCLRPNSAAKIQENSKRANTASEKTGRPATSTAKARPSAEIGAVALLRNN